MIKIIQYPKCSTCKKAVKFLQDNNVEFESR
ncbi:MAG: arsenate reductase family protein, partial [Eubacterium sp.]|nr:arsenate reductase family protein [Eubacterium sp.]